MVNRRTTLLAMVGAGLSAAAVGRAPDAEPKAAVPAVPPRPPGPERALQEDLAKLGSHEYSDEGIPVFLACVDLVAEQAGTSPPPAPSFSKRVAADLRRYGDAWQQMHPDAPDTDAGKIIEVLADRDFKSGGQGGGA